jgi:hypothetical protein
MEILLLVAIILVGASGLYVAATFNKRTKHNAAPLVNSVAKQIEDTGKDLRQQLHAITAELQEEMGIYQSGRSRTQERLDHADRQISSISDKLSTGLDTIKRQGAQIDTWQDQFSGNLQRQLDHQATQLSESLSRLSAQVAGIESYIRSQETQTIADLEGIRGSIQDMETRQSKAHGELASITRELDRQLASITQRLDRQAELNTRREDYDRRLVEQMTDTIRQIETVLHNQGIIESYLRTGLDYEVMKTTYDHRCRIVTASLRLDGPGADLLWPLLLSFCETVMSKAVLPESPPAADSRSYLLWQSPGGQLEELLSAKLAACQGSPEPPDQGQRDGLEELRSLVMTLHVSGPGTVQVGPMIINRTPRALLGCVMTATEAMHICGGATPTSPDAWEEALRELSPGRVTELTSWADSVTL